MTEALHAASGLKSALKPSRLMLDRDADRLGAADHAARRDHLLADRLSTGRARCYEIFITPLLASYKWQDLAVKAAPLIIIARRACRSATAPMSGTSAPRGSTSSARSRGDRRRHSLTQAHDGWLDPAADDRWRASSAARPGRRSRRCCRTRFNVNEILSSLMLTYVALQLLNYLVSGPWKDPNGHQLPADARCSPPTQTLPILIPGHRRPSRRRRSR